MDILSIAGTVFRRWYITVPIVLAALLIAFFAEREVPPEYEASGSVLLANPELDPARLPLTTQRIDALVADAQALVDDGSIGEPGTQALLGRVDGTTIALDVAAPDEAAGVATIQAVVGELERSLAEVQEENAIPEADRTEVITGATEIIATEEDLEGIDGFLGTDDATPGLGTDDTTPDLGAEEGALAGDGITPGAIALTARVFLSDPTAGINNPFGANAQTSRVLQVALHSDAGRTALQEEAGREISFEVTQNDRDAAPIVTVTTLATTPEQALEDFDHVVDALAAELDARQSRAQVPESRRVGIEVIAAPQEVEDVSPPLSRLTAAIIALGGLLALGVAIAVESVTSRRLSDQPSAPQADRAGDVAGPSRPRRGDAAVAARRRRRDTASRPRSGAPVEDGGYSDEWNDAEPARTV